MILCQSLHVFHSAWMNDNERKEQRTKTSRGIMPAEGIFRIIPKRHATVNNGANKSQKT
jgi:hypothetical protein